MGIRIQFSRHLIALMDEEDRQRYGDAGYHPADDPHPTPVSDKLEREEQRQFASWCLLHKIPTVWHSTAHRSKASLGCPDFIVGVAGWTLWIEFKRAGAVLSEDQEKFKALLEGQKIRYYLVYSAFEAIKLTEQYLQPLL